eukprot:COSAG02_NODE_10732_length_1872_cov_1.324309_1_plen_274_part_10
MPTLHEFLAEAQLESHADAIAKLGVTEINHLTDAEDEDLEQAGMVKLEIKRLRRHLTQHLGNGLVDGVEVAPSITHVHGNLQQTSRNMPWQPAGTLMAQQPGMTGMVQQLETIQPMMQQPLMSPQQQHQHSWASEEITNDLSSVCGCHNGCGSFCLAIFCPCVAYGQNRERAGLQPCLPAALSLAIPLMIIALIDTFLVLVLSAGMRFWHYTDFMIHTIPNLVSILYMVILAILLGPTRSNVQRITGVADGGCCNYVLGGCCSICILSQEHRII